MAITHIDHVGIAVADLDAAIELYEKAYGMTCVHIEVNEQQGVREAMMSVGDSGQFVQLLQPLSPESAARADSPAAVSPSTTGPTTTGPGPRWVSRSPTSGAGSVWWPRITTNRSPWTPTSIHSGSRRQPLSRFPDRNRTSRSGLRTCPAHKQST